MRVIDLRIFRVSALACIVLLAWSGIARAQTDTLSVPAGPTAQEILMGKVDSLRKAMSQAPDRRRRDIARRIAAADSLCLQYDFPAAADLLGNAVAEAD